MLDSRSYRIVTIQSFSHVPCYYAVRSYVKYVWTQVDWESVGVV